MIKTFGLGRTPETSLTWDERYPMSYVYVEGEGMKRLKRRLAELSESTNKGEDDEGMG